MPNWLRFLPFLLLFPLKAQAGDVMWTVSNWGCVIGNCLPEASSGYQCQSTDLEGRIWLTRAEEERTAFNAAQKKCVQNSDGPENCEVVARDCMPMIPYCASGGEDKSTACKLYGAP